MPLPAAGYPVSEEWAYNALATPFPSNFVLAREVTEFVGRIFTVRWKTLYAADKAAIEALWDSAAGAGGSFSWDHPDQGTVTVRFLEDSLAFVRRSAAVHSCELRIELEGP